MDELKWALHTLMHDIGLTDQEIINLTIRDLQLAGSEPHITVLNDDSGKERSVTLTDNTRQALVRWMLARPDRPVTLLFPGEADDGLSVEGVKEILTDYEPPAEPKPVHLPPVQSPDPSQNDVEEKVAISTNAPTVKPGKVRPPDTSPENLSRPVKPPPPLTSPESLQPAAVPLAAKKPSTTKPTPNTDSIPAIKPPASQKQSATKNVSEAPVNPAVNPKMTSGPESISTEPVTQNVKTPAAPVAAPIPEAASVPAESVESATPSPAPAPPTPSKSSPSQAEKQSTSKKTRRRLPLGLTLLVLLLGLTCFGLFMGSILTPGPLGSLATVPGTMMDQVGLGAQYAQLSTCIRTVAGFSDDGQSPDLVAVAPTKLPVAETAPPVVETATVEATATETATIEVTATSVPPTQIPTQTVDNSESVPQIDGQAPVSPIATPTTAATDTPEPTDTPTATVSPTETNTPSPTPTETPTETPTPTGGDEVSNDAEPATSNPIKYGTPQLRLPEPNFKFIQGNTVLLQWESVGDLAPDEQYAVRLVYFHANEPVYKGEQVRETEWMVPFALYHEADGPNFEYFWYVYVERVLADGTTIAISPESETRFFTWD